MDPIIDALIFAGGFFVGGVFHGSFVDLGVYVRDKFSALFAPKQPPDNPPTP